MRAAESWHMADSFPRNTTEKLRDAATLRTAHGNSPESGRQLSGQRQSSATSTAMIRDQRARRPSYRLGPPRSPRNILLFVADVAASGRRTGLSPLEAARQADLGRFAGWADAERIVGNLHRAYAEHEGAPPGAAIDVVEALSDMVAYNGGSPLTCLA